MGGFMLGVVVGVVVNLITALFSREKALRFLPWLGMYIIVHGAWVALSSEPIWSIAMDQARNHPSWWSYLLVIAMTSVLASLCWYSINTAVCKLDAATVHHSPPPPPTRDNPPPAPESPRQPTPPPGEAKPPSVAFIYADNKIVISNLGKGEFELWGTKLDQGPPSMESRPTLVPTLPFSYHIDADTFEREVLTKFGPNGEVRAPFRIFVAENHIKWTIICELWAVVKNNQITIETRNLGPKHGWLIEAAQVDEKPPTLADLFKTGFPNTMRVDGNSWALLNRDGGKVLEGPAKVYLDFDAKTKFIAFYVPRSDQSYSAAVGLWEQVQNVFASVETSIGMRAGYGHNPTDLKDLTFSGRVFLYHEDDFNLRQLADLVDVYKSHGMALDFRGPSFLGDQVIAWHREHDKRK